MSDTCCDMYLHWQWPPHCYGKARVWDFPASFCFLKAFLYLGASVLKVPLNNLCCERCDIHF